MASGQAVASAPANVQPSAEQARAQARCPLQVFVRIRPLLPAETGERLAWQATSDFTLACNLEEGPMAAAGPTAGAAAAAASTSGAATAGGSNTKGQGQLNSGTSTSLFFYNRVFSESSSSHEVYTAATHPLVLAAMRGYNGTVFAYGQTGSGKTFTMRAVMRQAAHEIFQHIAQNPDREFVLRMSAMEVYNEEVKDLLREGSGAKGGLKVLDDAFRGTHVEGLMEEGLRAREHLEALLSAVEARRHNRDTRMNASSSRSHQIVRIYIESRPARRTGADDASLLAGASDLDPSPDGKASLSRIASSPLAPRPTAASSPVTLSVLNFVDLAGSERQLTAGIEDADQEKIRQKEASNINKSLLWLGTVMRALGDGARHVSYRDSKLTRILQHSLSGNGHMAIICTISPAAGSVENTRAALHFANAAKRVVMRPQVNEVVDDKAVIKRMQEEIQLLRRQLAVNHQPAQELSAALEAKEQLVRQVAQEKDGLQRRLAGLERLILRGDGQVKERRSFDGSVDLAALGMRSGSETPEPPASGAYSADGAAVASAGGSGGGMRVVPLIGSGSKRGPAGEAVTAMRASWNPGSGSSPAGSEQQQGSGGAARRGQRGVGQPLELRLKPGVRRAVERVSESSGCGSSDGGAAAAGIDGSLSAHPLATVSSADGDQTAGEEGEDGEDGEGEDGMEEEDEGVEEEGGDVFAMGAPESVQQLLMMAGEGGRLGRVREEEDGLEGPDAAGESEGGGDTAPARPAAAAEQQQLQQQPAAAGTAAGPALPVAGQPFIPRLDFTKLQLPPGQQAAAATDTAAPVVAAAPVLWTLASVGAGANAASGSVPGFGAQQQPARESLDAQGQLKVEAALAALQAELRCIKVSCNTLTDIHSAVQSLTTEVKRLEESNAAAAAAAASGSVNSSLGGAPPGGAVSVAAAAAAAEQQKQQAQLLTALRAEVARLQAAAEAGAKADLALGALQKRLQEPAVDEGMLEAEAEATRVSLPSWLQLVLSRSAGHEGEMAGEGEEEGEEVQQPSAEGAVGAKRPRREGGMAAAVAAGGDREGAQEMRVSRRYVLADSGSSRTTHLPEEGSSLSASAEARTREAHGEGHAEAGGREAGAGKQGTSAQELGRGGQAAQEVSAEAGGRTARSVDCRRSVSVATGAEGQVLGPAVAVEAGKGEDSGHAARAGQDAADKAVVATEGGGEANSAAAAGANSAAAAVAAAPAGGSARGATQQQQPQHDKLRSHALGSHSAKAHRTISDASDLRALLPSASAASGAGGRDGNLKGPSSGLTPAASSASSLGGLDVSRVTRTLSGQKEAVKEWYKSELKRMHAKFGASAGKEVAELGRALEQLREHNERLELQKSLLLNRVLQTEAELESSTAANVSLREQVHKLTLDNAYLREAVQGGYLGDGQRQAGGAEPSDAASHGGRDHDLSIFDRDDSWEKVTPESLLPGIFEAWEQLHVPLIYRSHFYLNFKDKDTDERLFYYRMETQKLDFRKKRLRAVSSSSSGRTKDEERAAAALELERRGLAQNLKWRFSDEERERVLQEWGVNLATKGRKLQVMRSLWNPYTTLRQPDFEGARRSAQLVLDLAEGGRGGGGAAGGVGGAAGARGGAAAAAGRSGSGRFEESVYGTHEVAAGARPSSLGLAVTNLVKMVATPRAAYHAAYGGAASSARGGGGGAGGGGRSQHGYGGGSQMPGPQPAMSSASTSTTGVTTAVGVSDTAASGGPRGEAGGGGGALAATPRRGSWLSRSFLSRR